jgi:hypothetical protein
VIDLSGFNLRMFVTDVKFGCALFIPKWSLKTFDFLGVCSILRVDPPVIWLNHNVLQGGFVRRNAFVVFTLWALAASAVGAQADTAKTSATKKEVHSANGEVLPRRTPMLGVYDAQTGQPLEGVEVRDSLTGATSVTGKEGIVYLNFLAPIGPVYLFEMRKTGYGTSRVRVRVDSLNDRTEVLEPKPTGKAQNLAPVKVTEKYRIDRDSGLRSGFEARCGVKHAACFDEEWFSERPSYKLSDFLVSTKAEGIVPACGGPATRGVSSLMKASDPTKSKAIRTSSQCLAKMHSTGPALCTPTYFVNGFEWSSPKGVETQDELDVAYPAQNITGIEIYSVDQARPMRFTGDPRCGVIIIWTM